MKILKAILSLVISITLIGCGTTDAPQGEYNSVVSETVSAEAIVTESIEQVAKEESPLSTSEVAPVEEEEPEIDPKDYDYKTDPNTIAVNITAENLAEYVSPVVIEKPDGTFSVYTHSLMYDKGYVVMGYYYLDWTWDAYYVMDGNIYHFPFGSDSLFGSELCYKFETREQAQEYADKGIEAFNPVFKYDDSLIYFQKIEDVKYGYEMKNGKRILNGREYRSDGYFEENPF